MAESSPQYLVGPCPRLPVAYVDAGIHAVLPFCGRRERFGLAVRLSNGDCLRLALTADDARLLMRSLADYVGESLVQSAPSRLGAIDGKTVQEVAHG